jgi:hypothetical protein
MNTVDRDRFGALTVMTGHDTVTVGHDAVIGGHAAITTFCSQMVLRIFL